MNMIVDLRSDTLTKPTPAMREAMANAEVGDDVFGEDPTVHALEERVADLLGKEAALFVPSGVMGNQIAIAVHTSPGDEVILAERSHIYHYESGAPGQLSGVQLMPLGDVSGVLRSDDIVHEIRGTFDWEPRTSLVCLENTINKAGGTIYPMDAISEIVSLAENRDVALHLDGARLWNASVASGVSESTFATPFDTITVCLSKGLGAPVGSLLVGSRDHIKGARRLRKRFGGGMRQVGILAAAGLLALDQRDDLAEDHRRAKEFATAVERIPSFRVIPPETNIVLFETLEAMSADIQNRFEENSLRVVPFGPTTLRATFHRDITDDHLQRAVDVLENLYG